jgi:hypothetical protein
MNMLIYVADIVLCQDASLNFMTLFTFSRDMKSSLGRITSQREKLLQIKVCITIQGLADDLSSWDDN